MTMIGPWHIASRPSEFFFALGQIMGLMAGGEMNKWLQEHGVTDQEIKDFQALANRMASAAYFDDRKARP